MTTTRYGEIPAGLTVSYSGIRGIVGESLTPEIARRFGAAFGTMVRARAERPAILLARDTRPSGPELLTEVVRGIGAAGRLIDLDVVATPTIQFCLEHFHANGGVIVTASHNPGQWNGFKFFLGPENTVLDHEQTAQLLALVQEGTPSPQAAAAPEHAHDEAVEAHIQRVLAQLDLDRIRKRAFKIGLDAGRGAGHDAAIRLLDRLGCAVVDVQAERDSEPLPENLGALREAVATARCDLGFAQDLDADRLALIDESGRPAGEEFTLVLVVDYVLGKRPSHLTTTGGAVVVKNLSTTRAVDAVVALHGARLVETRVGEVNLSRALAREVGQGHFAFGGEGNGGVIWPAVSYGRDSLIGMGLVLEALAEGHGPLSERLASLPRYHERKTKVQSPGRNALDPIFGQVETRFPGGQVDHMDGIRVRFDDGSWVCVRPSNTEPILRLVAESPTAGWAEEAMERLTAIFR
jgi:phosphomannomutase